MTRFPRKTRLLRGGAWDAAPFLCVLFPCAFFLLFQSQLVLPTGTILTLPRTGTNQMALLQPGRIMLVVAVDATGRYYFDNRLLNELQLGTELATRLRRVPVAAQDDVVLYLLADREVTYEILNRVGRIARDAGIRDLVLAAQP